ncbi:MAG: CHAD domain-containing protein [Burkholderiales bacterium]|nr:CHAD domain-containing protein [Burkholderiales bacterium]
MRLPADASRRAAFLAISGASIAQIMANRNGARAGEDPEYVHQMRVGLRRLRSALRLFRGHEHLLSRRDRQAVKTLGRVLGGVRDLDVFAADIAGAGLAPAARRAALARLEPPRARAREKLLAWLDGPRHARLEQRLALSLAADRPGGGAAVLPFAVRALERAHRPLARAVRDIAALDEPALHALRIEVKRARYAAEFFATLGWERPAGAYARALAALQDALGRINDMASGRVLLTQTGIATRTSAQLMREWQVAARAATASLPQLAANAIACAGYWQTGKEKRHVRSC